MKYSIEQIKQFVNDGYEVMRNAKKLCIELLQEFPNQSLTFDWDGCDAPSISSGSFDDDLTDAYISRIYLDNGLLKADLHAYYLGEDRDGIDLGDECDVDYLDILDFINSNR